MLTGHIGFSILCAAFALCVSVSVGHPPLAWLLIYSATGISALMMLVYFRLRSLQAVPQSEER